MLKKSIVGITLLLMSSASASAQAYQLVWSDEFDDNTLGTNWNVEVVAQPANNELQYYTSRQNNVDVRNGNLVLTAIREDYRGRAFTSGRVNSNLKVSFIHGKIEARVKLPRLANGLWPAFWLMGEDIGEVGWPACGEIDIFEMGHVDGIRQSTQERLHAGCLHWGPNAGAHEMRLVGAVTAPTDITDDYHIFTAVWDENSLKFYLDHSSKPYYEASIKQGDPAAPYFHKPFHILLNLAVGGDYTNIHKTEGITALPKLGAQAEMLVDYVRIYQKRGARNVSFMANDKK